MESKCDFYTMQILLIAATKFEIEPFILNNNDVEILICGVGIPATSYHLQKKLQQNKFELVNFMCRCSYY